jgi:hypothetical protein
MLLTSNHGGGRSQVDVVGRALYQACRSSAPRARSIRDAIQGRARTQSTQQRNPTLPNREKAVTDQRDILLLASPAGSLSAPRSRADCRSDGGPYCTRVIAASPTTGREIRRRRRQNRRRRYKSMATSLARAAIDLLDERATVFERGLSLDCIRHHYDSTQRRSWALDQVRQQ